MIHLIKLSVGTESVENLAKWQARAGRRINGLHYHATRMWPRREAELLDGGSIFWVIQGLIQCRQKIHALEPLEGADGVRRCAICLDPDIIRVAPSPRRPFQGWRYLTPEDAPVDLSQNAQDDELPASLSAALAEIGVL